MVSLEAALLIGGLAAAAGIALALLLARRGREGTPGGAAQLASQVEALQRALATLQAQLDARLGQVAEQVSRAYETIGGGTATAFGRVSEGLARLEEAAKRIQQVGEEVAGLRDILQAPKLRGGLGELLLENLLAQALPRDRFDRQRTLRNGSVVDAVILLPGGLLPVDAKFPLEAYQRSLQATTEQERLAARREFLRSVRSRIQEIAERYIVPGETLEFALMYVPAEAVYYALIAEEEVMALAQSRQVIPVSPNTFWLYIQSVLVGLRGLVVQEEAQRVRSELAVLQREMVAFQEDFRVLGRHLRGATGRYDEAARDLDRLSLSLGRTTGLTGRAEPPALEGDGREGMA